MDVAFFTFLTANLHWEIWLCNKTTFCTLNNFSHRPDGEQWWIFTTLLRSLVNFHQFHWHWQKYINLLVYSIPHRYQKISLFLSIYQKLVRNQTLNMWFCLIDCIEVNSTWYSLNGTSQSAHAKSTISLFWCVLKLYIILTHCRWWNQDKSCWLWKCNSLGS